MFPTSWNLGRFAGIDLKIHPTFVLLPLLLLAKGGELADLLVLFLAFGCVVLHEYGHALMARSYGIGTADITLYPIGGVARLDRMPRSAGPELAIALAGPAVNLAILAVLAPGLWFVGPVLDDFSSFVLERLCWINGGLLLFNMLPIFPMDGGRVLRAILSGPLGRVRATGVAAELGRGIAVVGGVIALFSGQFMLAFAAAFLFMAGTAELNAVRRDAARSQAGSGWPTPPPGFRWTPRGDGSYRLAPVYAWVNDPGQRQWR